MAQDSIAEEMETDRLVDKFNQSQQAETKGPDEIPMQQAVEACHKVARSIEAWSLYFGE